MALELSARRGWLDAVEVSDFRELLEAMNLPVAPPSGMSAEQFLDLMGRDKKVVDGRLRLVLCKRIGDACVVDDAGTDELTGLLDAFLRAG